MGSHAIRQLSHLQLTSRLQKYASRFAALRPDDFGLEVFSALHANNYVLANYDILSIVKGLIGPHT